MAKRRRRRKAAPARKAPSAKTQTREHVDSMDVPNHMVSLTLPSVTREILGGLRFPLVHLQKSDGAADPTGLVFVDDRYGITTWTDHENCATPTWIEPEVFVEMALQDEEVQSLAAAAIKRRSKHNVKKIADELLRILSDQYIGYLAEQFDSTRHVIAEWILAHLAAETLDAPE